MTLFAVDLRNLVRMRVLLDVLVAVVAFEAAMDAFAEYLAVYCDAMPIAVGHAGIAVACEAFGLGGQSDRPREKSGKCQDAEAYGDCGGPFSPDRPNSRQVLANIRGVHHPAVFLCAGPENIPLKPVVASAS